jgi:hypothetical protein
MFPCSSTSASIIGRMLLLYSRTLESVQLRDQPRRWKRMPKRPSAASRCSAVPSIVLASKSDSDAAPAPKRRQPGTARATPEGSRRERGATGLGATRARAAGPPHGQLRRL